MELSEEKKREYVRRILLSRMRVLCSNGFFGLLLMHLRFALDNGCPTAATDGRAIYFNTGFLDSLTDGELDFVMMHEVMHCVLGHITRGEGFDHDRYNIAADIVVNSNILKSNDMNEKSIRFDGEIAMHVTPKSDEGYLYTAEEVYAMLGDSEKQSGIMPMQGGVLDDHSRWGGTDEELTEVWVKRFEDACNAIEIQEENSGRSIMPLFAKRMLKKLRNPRINWRTILNDFVQEDVCDYSFSPPDRRFGEFDFFLPDYSDKDFEVRDVLFMIDTSASMSDGQVTAAYSEVKGALDQFGGKLKGWLGFFEAGIIEPVPFSDVGEMLAIKPAGGGGTDFFIVFRYVAERMKVKPPACIIIFTDGYAPFPPEEMAMDIPVLWLINNDAVNPPWGRVARMDPKETF